MGEICQDRTPHGSKERQKKNEKVQLSTEFPNKEKKTLRENKKLE